MKIEIKVSLDTESDREEINSLMDLIDLLQEHLENTQPEQEDER